MDIHLLMRLILAHLLTDFPFQVDWVFRIKRDYAWGVLLHTSIFFVVGFLILMPLSFQPGVWTALLFLTVLHVLVDKFKLDYIKTQSRMLAVTYFLFDQVIHFGSVILLTWFICAFATPDSLLPDMYTLPAGNELLVVLIGFIAVVWACSIILFMLRYSTNRFPFRIWGIWERGFLYIGSVGMGWYPALIALALIPRLVIAIKFGRRNEFFDPFVLLASALALIVGLLLRFLYLEN